MYEPLVQGAVTTDLLLQLRLANMGGKKSYRRSAAERHGSSRHNESPPKAAVPELPSSSTQQEETKKSALQNAVHRTRHLKRATFEEMPNPDIGSRPYFLSTVFRAPPAGYGLPLSHCSFLLLLQDNRL